MSLIPPPKAHLTELVGKKGTFKIIAAAEEDNLECPLFSAEELPAAEPAASHPARSRLEGTSAGFGSCGLT